MKADLSTKLDCSAAKAWDEVQKSALLLHVMFPLIRIRPVQPSVWPKRWSEGSTIKFKCFVFGFIPIGIRTLRFNQIDHVNHKILTHEYDPLIKQWDHTISVTADGPDATFYRDEIEIDAGASTWIVWAWANYFYRHRQARWRKLAPSL
jgi:hypothetical protein